MTGTRCPYCGAQTRAPAQQTCGACGREIPARPASPLVPSELEQLKDAVAACARQHPTEVLLAILDQLIESTSGDNPALKDYHRTRFYRAVARALVARGLIEVTR